MFVKLAAVCIMFIFTSAIASAADAPTIRIEGAKAVMANPTLGAAYGTITADGDDTLTGVNSDCCKAVELHQSSMLNGTMSMRKISEAKITRKKPLQLVPHAQATGASSMHIMLIGAKAPLKAGESVDVTLTFKKAGAVKQSFPIEAMSAHGNHEGHAGH